MIRRNTAGRGAGISVRRAPFFLDGVIIAENKASGFGGALNLNYEMGESTVANTTIVGNTAQLGSVTRSENLAFITFTGCLIAGNPGRTPFSSHFGAGFAMGCSNVWGNGGELKWPPLFTDLGGIFHADPLLCGGGDYRLQDGSPCLPGQHPDGGGCGLIGALGQGCGTLVSAR